MRASAVTRLCIYVLLCAVILTFTGCMPKIIRPEFKPGPQGGVAAKQEPTWLERFTQPPAAFYDLEMQAGLLFEALNKTDWARAQKERQQLSVIWQDAKTRVGDKKGVKEADEAMEKLALAVNDGQLNQAAEQLNKFMGGVSEILKNYKLSPLSDIVRLGNVIRSVSFYVADKDWSKAAVKAMELDKTWGEAKVNLEQPGILGEVTKAHGAVSKIRDAVEAENKDAAAEQLKRLNESMAKIREYYRR